MKIKMKNLKKENGITLVALIITIIVLLILAIVSIRLVMNGGIIGRAEKGTKAYSEAEVQEQIKLAYAEWQTAQFTGETRTAADFVKDRLNSTYGEGAVTDVTETSAGVFTVKFSDGKEYTYNVTTGTTEKVAKWNDNGDGTWTHSITGNKIQIGDIVNYNELSNGAKSYTTDTSKGIGGSVGTQDSTTKKYPLNEKTYTTEDLTWRVLGVNERGQIELISENPTSEDVYLANEEGYLYGPDALNTMCDDLYGKGNGAESARSLNADDVDKLAGITTEADKKTIDNNYGSKWQFRFPAGGPYLQSRSNSGSGYGNWTDITYNVLQAFRMPGETTTINSSNPGEGPELTYTQYIYKLSERLNKTAVDGKNMTDLILKGTTNNYILQFLASDCISCNEQNAGFFVNQLYNGYVTICQLYYSRPDNYSFNSNSRIRPVVTLKSNIQLSGSSSEGWTIE